MAALQIWAGVDPDAAGAQALTMPESQMRDQVLGQIVAQLTEREPAAALRFIEKMPFGNSRDQAIRTVVQQIAETDPKSAAGYAAGLPEGAAQRVRPLHAAAARSDESGWRLPVAGRSPDA